MRNCDCGVMLDAFGFQFLTCKVGGGAVWQNNLLVSTWSRGPIETKLSQETDTLTRRIIEILLILTPIYSSEDLDVSMAHPLSANAVKGAAVESGYAAREKERGQERAKMQSATVSVWLKTINSARF